MKFRLKLTISLRFLSIILRVLRLEDSVYNVYIANHFCSEAVDMNGRFQMQGGKNWFLPKKMNANRFFWDSHWLEIWSNHFYPSMGPNGGSVAMDSDLQSKYDAANNRQMAGIL